MGIDPFESGLVWVRRRNGSWWPGQILDQNELPESEGQILRSRTPVKLLGKDDAIVDCYNLDRSKRIRPFRCGEYDDCIKKAKIAASRPSSKANIYDKRENAIIHALKIEKAQLEKDVQNEQLQNAGRAPFPFDLDEESDKIGEESSGYSSSNSSSSSEEDISLSQSGVSFQEPDSIKEWRNSNNYENYGTEGVVKRERSQAAPVYEFSKRKNRGGNLTKVFESTASNKTSNSARNRGVSCQNDSFGMLFDVPLVAEENKSKGLSAISPSPQPKCEEHNNRSSSTSSHSEGKVILEWRSKGKRNYRVRKIKLESNHIYMSGLYDVTIEVNSETRGQHVPFISLMSVTTGLPVVGHPITIEILRDKDLADEQRRPRGKPQKKYRASKMSNSAKKSRANRSVSKKVRKLSSVTNSNQELKPVCGSNQELKPVCGKLKGPPSVACVPLTVVFSRINADLNSWVRPAHR